jgi:predicted small lipoprotein YifL
MIGVPQILVSPTAARRRVLAVAAAAMLLSACGQKGPLFLPTGAAAQGRVGLPQTLTPEALSPAAPSTAVVPAAAASQPRTGTASPIRNP